jgi:hypothetical protein
LTALPKTYQLIYELRNEATYTLALPSKRTTSSARLVGPGAPPKATACSFSLEMSFLPTEITFIEHESSWDIKELTSCDGVQKINRYRWHTSQICYALG